MECIGINSSELLIARQYYREKLSNLIQPFNILHGYAYFVLCIVGFFANLSIIIVLLRPAMRKSPFNLFLICIALCDASLMLTYVLFKHVDICHPWYFSYHWIVYTQFYAIFSVFVHSASLWMTVNMALLRFLVLYRGNSSNSRLPPCNGYPAAIIAIILGVLIAFLGSFPNSVRYTIIVKDTLPVPPICLNHTKYASFWTSHNNNITFYDIVQPNYWNCTMEGIFFWVTAWVLKLIPCILLTVFMALLVRMLIEARERRSRLCGGVSTGNSQAERTTAMLTSIVAVFLVTELPQGLMQLAAGINPRLTFVSFVLGNIFDLLSLINSSVNFVLCALMSHVFRREFIQTFGMCCPVSSESHSGAPVNKLETKSTNGVFDRIRSRLPHKKNGFAPVPTTCAETIQQSMKEVY